MGVVKTDLNVLNLVSVQNESDIVLIPLTEEWLLKFGFVKKHHFHNFSDFWKGKLKINTKDSVNFYHNHKNRIRYVHELQNLYFELTGKELI